MTASLTPYDTGDRLEPQPWRLTDNDHYGYVDLDDDESATVFTIVGKRPDHNTADGSPGYLMSVSTYSDDTAVEIDGDRVLVLDEDTLADLKVLIELAQRGRDDFQHHAENTRDYSEEDIAAADDAWHLVQGTIKRIQGARP